MSSITANFVMSRPTVTFDQCKALLPPKHRKPEAYQDALLIGFAVDFTPISRRLLSIRLAARDVNGSVLTHVYPVKTARITPAFIATCVWHLLDEAKVETQTRKNPRQIVLVCPSALSVIGVFDDPEKGLEIKQIGQTKAHHAEFARPVDGPGKTKWNFRIADRLAFAKDSTGESAEAALVAFASFRQEVFARHGVEVLNHLTPASTAAAIFRKDFLFSAPRRHKMVLDVKGRVTPVVLGDPEIRRLAMQGYRGGRSEAYIHGLYVGSVAALDVNSLYPHAAILQPLCCATTRWRSVKTIADVRLLEGFAEVKFEFPKGTTHPCLPVKQDALCFPLRGISICTFSEIRAALSLGAEIEIMTARGFEPGKAEREHDIGQFMKHFLAQKKQAAKGTAPYEAAKNMLNLLIGKLIGQSHDPQKPWIGSLWVPEWHTLILGKSRAIMAEVVARGALQITTDGVIVPTEIALQCRALTELESVGSGLRLEHEGDACWIGRAQMYAILQRAGNVRPRTEVLAVDANWAVVRVARGGTSETTTQFAQTMLLSIAAGQAITTERHRTRLMTAEAAEREGKRIGSEVEETSRTKFSRGHDRRLVDRDVDQFRNYSQTESFSTIDKQNEAQKKQKSNPNRQHPQPTTTKATNKTYDTHTQHNTPKIMGGSGHINPDSAYSASHSHFAAPSSVEPPSIVHFSP